MGFVLAFLLRPLAGSAQETVPVQQHLEDKPQLFAQLPDEAPCRVSDFKPYFLLHPHDLVTLDLSDQLKISGEVQAVSRQNNYVTNINIRSTNYPGGLLTLSQITRPGEPTLYTGRFIQPDRGDLILITREGGRYIIRKQLQKYFMTE